MALIPCQKCSKEISHIALTCPHCDFLLLSDYDTLAKTLFVWRFFFVVPLGLLLGLILLWLRLSEEVGTVLLTIWIFSGLIGLLVQQVNPELWVRTATLYVNPKGFIIKLACITAVATVLEFFANLWAWGIWAMPWETVLTSPFSSHFIGGCLWFLIRLAWNWSWHSPECQKKLSNIRQRYKNMRLEADQKGE